MIVNYYLLIGISHSNGCLFNDYLNGTILTQNPLEMFSKMQEFLALDSFYFVNLFNGLIESWIEDGEIVLNYINSIPNFDKKRIGKYCKRIQSSSSNKLFCV
jgi:hypothetical protein